MSIHKDILISVISPCYNEEEAIGEFIEQTIKVLDEHFPNYELLLIDDGSKDGTVEKISTYQKNNTNIRLIRFSRNFGKEAAVTAGLEHSNGEIVVMLDSDLQDPPSLIPELVTKLDSGYDIVSAQHTVRKKESWLKKRTSKMFYRLAQRMTGLAIPDTVGDYRVMRRKVVDAVISVKDNVRYMKMIYAYVGFRNATVLYEREPRFAGETKYNYPRLIEAALDAIISFSDRPLRYISLMCVGISISAFLLTIYVILYKILAGNTAEIANGWTSLVVLINTLFCLLFAFLAIISEYISRILRESKRRPLYFAEEIKGGRIDYPSILPKK
ncbi:MAG: glycosyltransferase family 2 protein [Rickettsiales bacterium]